MFLIEVFVPTERGDGSTVPSERIDELVQELASRFGGATAFLRSPAKGLWREPSEELEEDRVIIVEVMVDQIERGWWNLFRQGLERELLQEKILVRATACEII